MELKNYLLLGLLALLPILSNAQRLTYLNIEAGPQWSLIKVSDRGQVFEQANVLSSVAGLTISQELLPNLSLSTGLLLVPRRDGINMIDDRPHQSSWVSYNSILIPLRLAYRIQPTEQAWSFTPRLGYVHDLGTGIDEPYTASGILMAPDGTSYTYQVDQSIDQPNMHLLEVGMGLNVSISGFWRASLNLSYMTAVFDSPSTRQSLSYTDQNSHTSTIAYSSKGNSLYTTIAFNLPLSNIWQRRDYRIRKRIEGSIYEGKAVDRKGEFYLGSELGSLWRMFLSSDPAIGPRPLAEGGLFRYANFHGGIYGGYMFSNFLGIDLGVNYQRSSVFYAIMIDHQVDYTQLSAAPMYLEIPIRIRYLHPLVPEELFLSAYTGISLLTHFSGDAHSQGSGEFSFIDPLSGSTSTASTSWSSSRASRLVPMLRLGVGAEYLLPTRFALFATLYVNYLQGIMNVNQTEVSTSIPHQPEYSTLDYQGSGWSVNLGVKLPFRFDSKGICGLPPKKAREKRNKKK